VIRMFVSLIAAALVVIVSSPAAAAQSKQDSRARVASGSLASTRPVVFVNLNTATQTELEQLPGIGPKTAALIIEYRQKKGPFKKIEELMNVKGIGEKSFLKLKPQLTVAARPDSNTP
jgi:competence protein ComEA